MCCTKWPVRILVLTFLFWGVTTPRVDMALAVNVTLEQLEGSALVTFPSITNVFYRISTSTNVYAPWQMRKIVKGRAGIHGLYDPDAFDQFGSHYYRIEQFALSSLVDSDGDGLTDFQELYQHGTDPMAIDSDADGVGDGIEAGSSFVVYTLVDTNLDWAAAQRDAVARGGVLASPGHAVDRMAISNAMARSIRGREVWIGGSYVASTGWVWVTGQAVTSFYWAASYPSQQVPGRAVAIDGVSGGLSMRWIDLAGSSRRAYLMQETRRLNPLLGDTDGDGISDADELAAGSNPCSVDSDYDGIHDGDELAMGWNPTNPADAFLDSDSDGIPNVCELLAGTDPLQSTSRDYAHDADGDGFTDFYEYYHQTDPLNRFVLPVATRSLLTVMSDTAADLSTNAPYADGWTDGDNGGTGCEPWRLRFSTPGNVNVNGAFMGSSLGNGSGAGPGIDTGGASWGLYANGGNIAAAFRSFIQPLTSGSVLRVKMDNGWIDNGTSVGVVVRRGKADASAGDYATGAEVTFRFAGGNANYQLVDANGTRNTVIPWTEKGLALEFSIVRSTQCVIRATSYDNPAVTHVYTSKLSGAAIESLAVFNQSAGGGSPYNAYFNAISASGPSRSIQATIQAAAPYDIISVPGGEYVGPSNRNIRANGKHVMLLGSTTGAATIVNVEGLGRGFVFDGGEDARLIVKGVSVINGQAGSGGGVYLAGAGPILRDLAIRRCSAATGGGVHVQSGLVHLHNVLLESNTASRVGGALSIQAGATALVVNATLVRNSAPTGAAVHAISPSAVTQLWNSIVWYHGANAMYPAGLHAAYSTVEGGWPGIGMRLADPRFVDGDYRLGAGSPCLDAGWDDVAPALDQQGEGRWRALATTGDGLTDQGYDEYVDIDRDGLPDRNEAARGTDPYLPDTDGDGLSDAEEVMAGRSYYEVVMGGWTWSDAAANAQWRGGHLATITSPAEQDTISNLLWNVLSRTNAWIGATDQGTDGTWRWVTGEPWSFHRWAAGEPSQAAGEDYGHIGGHWFNDMLWNDEFNQATMPYLFEGVAETDPLVFDTDRDGVGDGAELAAGRNPRSPSYTNGVNRNWFYHRGVGAPDPAWERIPGIPARFVVSDYRNRKTTLFLMAPTNVALGGGEQAVLQARIAYWNPTLQLNAVEWLNGSLYTSLTLSASAPFHGLPEQGGANVHIYKFEWPHPAGMSEFTWVYYTFLAKTLRGGLETDYTYLVSRKPVDDHVSNGYEANNWPVQPQLYGPEYEGVDYSFSCEPTGFVNASFEQGDPSNIGGLTGWHTFMSLGTGYVQSAVTLDGARAVALLGVPTFLCQIVGVNPGETLQAVAYMRTPAGPQRLSEYQTAGLSIDFQRTDGTHVREIVHDLTARHAPDTWHPISHEQVVPNEARQCVVCLKTQGAGSGMVYVDKMTGMIEPDFDADGMPDAWEVRYGLATNNPWDALADLDLDDVDNLDECRMGTDPLVLDSDGDGLPDGWELEHGLDPNRAADGGLDPDQDDMTSAQERAAGTHPAMADSDGDSLPDGLELFDLGTDPLARNEGMNLHSVQVIAAGSFARHLGQWDVFNDSAMALDVRGWLEYDWVVTTADTYRLVVAGRAASFLDKGANLPLRVYLDGVYLGHFSLYSDRGYPDTHAIMTPYTMAGTHQLRIEWDNASRANALQLDSIEVQAILGPDSDGNGVKDWVTHWLDRTCALDPATTNSFVSPATIGGAGRYPSLMRIDGSQVAGPGGFNRWTAEVSLPPTGKNVTVTYQNGAKQETASIQWLAINPLDTGRTSLVIRVGDTVRFDVVPEVEDPLGIRGLTVAGLATFDHWADYPVPQLFSATGSYPVVATYHYPGGAGVTGTVVVTVVQDDLGVAPLCWVGKTRPWAPVRLHRSGRWSADERIVLDPDLVSASWSDYILGTDDIEPRMAIRRAPDHHRRLSAMAVDGIQVWSSTETYLEVVQVNPDGSTLAETMIVVSPRREDITLVSEIFIGGVTYEDGTTIKTIQGSELDALGTVKLRFLVGSGANASLCNKLRLYHDGKLIGVRNEF